MKRTDIIIALMMVAVSTSETSVNFCETIRRNIPEVIFISIQLIRKVPNIMELKDVRHLLKIATRNGDKMSTMIESEAALSTSVCTAPVCNDQEALSCSEHTIQTH
jgi:hypothetical protein